MQAPEDALPLFHDTVECNYPSASLLHAFVMFADINVEDARGGERTKRLERA